MEPDTRKANTNIQLGISGVVSACVTKTAVAPLDRLRLLYQVQGMMSTQSKYTSIYDSIRTIYKEEGAFGLWRGNLTNMMRAAVVYAVKFSTNDIVKGKLQSQNRSVPTSSKTSTSTPDTSTKGSHLSISELLIAGSTAGILQKGLSFPMDMISVRMALGINTSTLNYGGKSYQGIWDCVRRVHSKEGLTGFYKGFGPTLLTGHS